MTRLTRVIITQRRLTHYRVSLFDALRGRLAQRGVELQLLVGRGLPQEEKKNDCGELSWAVRVRTYYALRGRFCWQSFGKLLSGADLVIVTQENRLLHNHLLLFAPRRFKLAFWGHGANLQSANPRGFKECFKRWTTGRVDWWFAYTTLSADLVAKAGFPSERITVLNNAVDTAELMQQRKSVSPDDTLALREVLGFDSAPVGVYVGSLYPDKRLGFLFAAAEAIRRDVPDFRLLLVGDGPERETVESWCASRPWARWVGARFGREKALHLSLAHVMLNPGLVGLGILDAFVCGVPMLTTECGLHSPEIAYLNNGVNGVMTVDDLGVYTSAAVTLLTDQDALARLRAGCADSALGYTVDNMASRFADGIVDCIEAPRCQGAVR